MGTGTDASERVTVTAQDILEAILGAQVTSDSPGAFTVAEMAAQSGHSDKWVRAQLVKLKRDGRLELVTVTRERLDGMRVPVMAYRMRAQSLGE